jgi:hypothetical protein
LKDWISYNGGKAEDGFTNLQNLLKPLLIKYCSNSNRAREKKQEPWFSKEHFVMCSKIQKQAERLDAKREPNAAAAHKKSIAVYKKHEET